jgi:alkylation response protein AidB-like acyl-CoA dehydrogenase
MPGPAAHRPSCDDLDSPALLELARGAARATGPDADSGIEMAVRLGALLPAPGAGATALRWQVLSDVAAIDLTAARILEAHSDALAILDEAGEGAPLGSWGVFAAEAPSTVLTATEANDGTWSLTGTKAWCSLGGKLDSALVTAQISGSQIGADRDGTGRGLFAVDLHQPAVTAEPVEGWVARGLTAVPSGPVRFAAAVARPIGPRGWYLTRPGFAWGGIGVAACWLGGAQALAGRLAAYVAQRPDDPLRLLQLGTVDAALHSARCTLAEAAAQVDGGDADGRSGVLLALRVRAVVADAVETTLRMAGHALGPAPLAFEEEHARRVADLSLYVRQHHAERDLAALGQASLEERASPSKDGPLA